MNHIFEPEIIKYNDKEYTRITRFDGSVRWYEEISRTNKGHTQKREIEDERLLFRLENNYMHRGHYGRS